ncbi:energy transducer TonB [Xanthocytophaga flava]|uniref:energy transducer TonB n=1 Tax=Xanthocytophaga flava TaxID=3048013 RepID=UPI0028D7F6BD|nr:TonB family protein [Xanthocytophaga flavus]MDJ1470189.1 TonB family protein [Xanthocytophaga flavus]
MKKFILVPVLLLTLAVASNSALAQKKKAVTSQKPVSEQNTNLATSAVASEKKEYVAEQLTDEQALEMVTQQLEAATGQVASVEAPVADENRIYTVVDASAQFPGGTTALNQFIATNLHYPKEAKKENISGKVYTKLLIEKDGSISSIQMIKGLGHGCDQEAIRVIKSMPNWKPAHQQESIVRSYYMLQVNFDSSLSK